MPRWTGKTVVAVLTIAAGWGGWQFRSASGAPSPAPNVMTPPAAVPRLAAVAVVPSSARQSTQRAKALPEIASESQVREAPRPAPSAATTVATAKPLNTRVEESRPTRTAGSAELVTAKATTWVNVRAEANSKSTIVGMILPDSIVELGEARGGWRRVSTRWFSGWASARLFAVDSLGR